MSIEDIVWALNTPGLNFFVAVRHYLREFLGNPPRALTWKELAFLTKNCSADARLAAASALEHHLPLTALNWEEFVDHVRDCVPLQERPHFYRRILQAKTRVTDRATEKRTCVPTTAVADLMAMIEPDERAAFIPFFKPYNLVGNQEDLTRAFKS